MALAKDIWCAGCLENYLLQFFPLTLPYSAKGANLLTVSVMQIGNIYPLTTSKYTLIQALESKGDEFALMNDFDLKSAW